MPQTIQRSFTGGEIAPSLRSRADLSKYTYGLALCENFFIRAQGGAYSRPGMRFIGEVGQSNKRARLIPFSFSTDQTYILVFEDLTMQVIKDGGFVLKPAATITNVTQANPAVVTTSAPHTFVNGENVTITGVVGMTELNGNTYQIAGVTANTFQLVGVNSTGFTAYSSGGSAQSDGHYQIVTPFTEAQVARIGFTQSADVMTIVHPTHDPRNINRLADDNWTITTVSYAPTVTAPGALTLGTTGAGGGSNTKTYEYVVTTVDADGVESLPSPSNNTTVASLSVTFGVTISWAAVGGADYYRVYKATSVGSNVFGWIGDTRTNGFDDFNIAPVTSDSPPSDRQPFTGPNNKPSAVNYYQQRQIFANSRNEPQTVYMTQTGNYQSLRVSNPARDDDAITFTIAARQVNEIRHIVALDALILLTSGGEWKVTEGQDQVLTPSTIGVRIQTYNGASWVPPAVINDTVVYVQEKGSRLRDLNYQFANDKYSGNDLSIMSEHLFEGYEIEEMAYSAEPYSILWCVRSDGRLLGLTYQREHQVWAWHQHVTDGIIESVATITEDGRDAVYLCIKRNINGADVRYVERMESRIFTSSEDCFCVDSGLTYNGSPATVITGLDHLEGEAVVAVADGNVVRDLTVVSGQITIPNESSVVHVGLEFTPVLETLDIDTASVADTLKAKRLSVAEVNIEVEASRGGWVGPKRDDGSTGTMYEIKPRFDSDFYDPIALQTGKYEIYASPEWQKTGGLRIEQRDPLPLAILSIIPDVDVGG